MIVTRAKAEEAAFLLGIDIDCPLTREQLDEMYRAAAKKTHPDMGGSAEAFARVDWAKHVLLKWLEKSPTAATPMSKVDCPRCNGTGRITRHKGFTSMPMQCHSCHGTGDGTYDKETARE